MMDREEKLYFHYLSNLIKTSESKNYYLLLKHLWNKEYYSILPNDQNREKDGVFLREEVDNDTYYYNFGPCRVLEMLIALSRRMAFELDGTNFNKTSVDLFWEMVDNLGLSKFDNLTVAKDVRTLELDSILTNWIDRRYAPDGIGGIFPIKNWKKACDEPQQNVEIWYQMMTYLSKNYDF